MPGLCYYVPMPKEPKLSLDDLKRLRFPHIEFAKCPGIHGSKGPDTDGGGGYFFRVDEMPGGIGRRKGCRVGFHPEIRTWTETPDGYWIGFDTNDRPRPVDVLIPAAPEGYRIKLLDDNEWVMPIVRQHTGDPALPRIYGLEDGKKTKVLRPGYEGLWDIACRMHDTLGVALGDVSDAGNTPLTMDEAFTACGEAFSMNYAISEWELRALGLCTEDELASMIHAMVDLPMIIAVAKDMGEKKNQEERGTA